MKKILLCLVISCFMILPVNVEAKDNLQIEYLDNGIIVETYISDVQLLAMNKTSGTKTKVYKDSKGKVLYSIKVIGTFEYDGRTSWCTSSKIVAESKSSAWKLSQQQAYGSGNKAIASATAKNYVLGIVINTRQEKVTLSCSSSGKLA